MCKIERVLIGLAQEANKTDQIKVNFENHWLFIQCAQNVYLVTYFNEREENNDCVLIATCSCIWIWNGYKTKIANQLPKEEIGTILSSTKKNCAPVSITFFPYVPIRYKFVEYLSTLYCLNKSMLNYSKQDLCKYHTNTKIFKTDNDISVAFVFNSQ